MRTQTLIQRVVALVFAITPIVLVGCPPKKPSYKIPKIEYRPPRGANLVHPLACPAPTSPAPPSIPQLCNVGLSTDCTKAANIPAGGTAGTCDSTATSSCPNFGYCTFGLAPGSNCWAGETRYCDLSGQTCNPTSGGTGCGTQPCQTSGFNWVTTECDPLTTNCGLGGQTCCTGGSGASYCADGFNCVGGQCQSCGAPNQTCCAPQNCYNGAACNMTTHQCEACGSQGSVCCPGSQCGVGSVCFSGLCLACGAAQTHCCGGSACNAGLTCDSTGMCTAPCGGAAQACCAGGSCSAGLTCSNGVCATTCGAPGQTCCAGSACNGGATCMNGSCVACGGVHQPCCGGTSCSSGFACDAIHYCECANGSQEWCAKQNACIPKCTNCTARGADMQCHSYCSSPSVCQGDACCSGSQCQYPSFPDFCAN